MPGKHNPPRKPTGETLFLPQGIDAVAFCVKGGELWLVWPSTAGLHVQVMTDDLGAEGMTKMVSWNKLRRELSRRLVDDIVSTPPPDLMGA